MTTTMIQGNYQARRTPEGVMIYSVEISNETSKARRPDFLRDLDVATFKQMLRHYNRRTAASKVGAFVLLDHEGAGVGRIAKLWVENKQLKADLLITNTAIIGMIERGELTERSLEWGWSMTDAKLKGVALLSGKYGEDSEGWPDLTIRYVDHVEGDYPEFTDLYAKTYISAEFEDFSGLSFKTQFGGVTLTGVSNPDKENHMPLSKEDLTAITQALQPAIKAAVDEAITAHKGVADDMEPVNDKNVDEALQRIQRKEREITITGFVENLARKGYSNKKHLRASFEKFGDNTTAMEVEFKRLMEKADEDVKLEMEDVYEKPTLDAELEDAYKEFQDNYPHVKVTKAEFKSICKGENKNPLVDYTKAIEVK